MEEESKYYGGNLWESPSHLVCMIVCADADEMILISDPKQQGSCVNHNEGGKWIYSMPALKVRLLGWKWAGTHKDYIEDLCKHIKEEEPK